MLCCLGLFAGFTLGSMLGGPWTFIAPTIGFGLGLVGDMKLMRSTHGSHGGSGGGCCGGGLAHDEKGEKDPKDPVCGMGVDERTATYKAEFNGKTYYFCSHMCMSTFKKDPTRYAR